MSRKNEASPVSQRVSFGTKLKGSEVKGFGVSKVSPKMEAKSQPLRRDMAPRPPGWFVVMSWKCSAASGRLRSAAQPYTRYRCKSSLLKQCANAVSLAMRLVRTSSASDCSMVIMPSARPTEIWLRS